MKGLHTPISLYRQNEMTICMKNARKQWHFLLNIIFRWNKKKERKKWGKKYNHANYGAWNDEWRLYFGALLNGLNGSIDILCSGSSSFRSQLWH